MKAEVPTDISCPLCGSKMVIRSGKKGLFLGCSNFPQCKGTANFTRDQAGNISLIEREDLGLDDKTCPKCGAGLVKKDGRFGSFLACSDYPKCKYTASIEEQEDLGRCPKEGCDGRIVKRRTKKGKVFYGCSNYPACDYVSWQKPSQESKGS
jgi:DNA topoisomerase-1